MRHRVEPNIFSKITSTVRRTFNKTEEVSASEIFETLEKRYQNSTRVVATVSIAAILLFITATFLLPFKDQLFNILYQKPPSLATTENLIKNGGFESGNLNSWQADNTTITNLSYSGSFAANIKSGKLSQKVIVTPNKTYILKAWVYLSEISGSGGPRIYIDDLVTTGLLQNTVTPNSWSQITLEFKPVTSEINITASIEGRFTGNFYLDEVSLSAP